MGRGEESAESNDEEPDGDEADPTPQPTALRRQQRQIAIGGSVLSGVAVTVMIIQRFPEYSVSAVIAGVVGGLFVYKLAARSIFPGSRD
jgi:hypothetical protein